MSGKAKASPPVDQKNPELHIIFDSSSIHPGEKAALNFMNYKMRSAVETIRKAPDIVSHWYLPEIVKEERLFQMRKRAATLYAPIRDAERLLKRDFQTTHQSLQQGVEDGISSLIKELGLLETQLDPGQVDWGRIVLSAVRREPPFQDSEKEKGFRDAIVLETFIQLARNKLKVDSDCRILFVAADGLLNESAAARVKELDPNRVSVLSNVDELVGIVNAVPAHLSLSAIREITDKAEVIFYDPREQAGLFVSGKLKNEIFANYRDLLEKPPPDAPLGSSVRLSGLEVSSPIFREKKAAVLTFVSQVSVLLELDVPYQNAHTTPIVLNSTSPYPGVSGTIFATGVQPVTTISSVPASPFAGTSPTFLGFSNAPPLFSYSNNMITISSGNTAPATIQLWNASRQATFVFDVVWQATLQDTSTLTAPKIVGLKHNLMDGWE